MAEYGDIVRLPSAREEYAEKKPGDIIASFNPKPLVKGCTIDGGQGVLAAGTVLGVITATGLYAVYANGNLDGTETAVGVLLESVDTGAAGATDNVAGNIVLGGVLKSDKLTGLDAGAIADLNGQVNAQFNYFRF